MSGHCILLLNCSHIAYRETIFWLYSSSADLKINSSLLQLNNQLDKKQLFSNSNTSPKGSVLPIARDQGSAIPLPRGQQHLSSLGSALPLMKRPVIAIPLNNCQHYMFSHFDLFQKIKLSTNTVFGFEISLSNACMVQYA